MGCLLAQWLVIHPRMAPPHTRVCGWRHITRQATFLACVIELGQTGSSLNPPAVMIPQKTTQTISCKGLGLTPSIPTPSRQGRARWAGQGGQTRQGRQGQGGPGLPSRELLIVTEGARNVTALPGRILYEEMSQHPVTAITI